MDIVLQDSLPHAPWMTPHTARLPGVQPSPPDGWLVQDEAFAGQMALRDFLISHETDRVHAMCPEGEDGAAEVLSAALALLRQRPGYEVASDHVIRPDGVRVALNDHPPLHVLGRLIQEDICVLTPSSAGHVLSGAVLCFPASWTLAEKIGRPLDVIHRPVEEYGPVMVRRVQRMFDKLRVEAPLWRSNALLYENPALFQPRSETAPRVPMRGSEALYLRSERQTLFRLPVSDAVVFAIHTWVVRKENLTVEQAQGLAALETVSVD